MNLAGQEGLEPPTSGFGDRRSTNSSYWPVYLKTQGTPDTKDLLRFAMDRVGSTGTTELLKLQPFRRLFLVLGG